MRNAGIFNRTMVAACLVTFSALHFQAGGQERLSPREENTFPATDTVSVLRTMNRPDTYATEWLGYMGLTAVGESTAVLDESEALLNDVLAADDAAAVAASKIELVPFVRSNASPGLKSSVLYGYYNRRVDLDASPISADVFSAELPSWGDLDGFLPKFIVSYAYMDQAWQCKAEGDVARAAGYYERVRDTALALFREYPDDPNQIWVVYNYMFAASGLGPEAMTDAIRELQIIVATQPSSILTWSSRYQIGLFSSLLPNVPDEHRAQYEAMVAEAELPFFTAALADGRLTRDAKGMIELMKGHALFGTHQFSDAEEQYKQVLANYGDRMEWAPRDTGRAIVDRSNYGVCGAAGYSLAKCAKALHALEPDRAAEVYEGFMDAFPDSEYTDRAALDLGGLLEKTGATTEARDVLTSLVGRTKDASLRERAESILDRLSVSTP